MISPIKKLRNQDVATLIGTALTLILIAVILLCFGVAAFTSVSSFGAALPIWLGVLVGVGVILPVGIANSHHIGFILDGILGERTLLQVIDNVCSKLFFKKTPQTNLNHASNIQDTVQNHSSSTSTSSQKPYLNNAWLFTAAGMIVGGVLGIAAVATVVATVASGGALPVATLASLGVVGGIFAVASYMGACAGALKRWGQFFDRLLDDRTIFHLAYERCTKNNNNHLSSFPKSSSNSYLEITKEQKQKKENNLEPTSTHALLQSFGINGQARATLHSFFNTSNNDDLLPTSDLNKRSIIKLLGNK